MSVICRTEGMGWRDTGGDRRRAVRRVQRPRPRPIVGCFADDVAVYGFPSGTEMLTAGDPTFRDTYRAVFDASPMLHAELLSRIVQGRIVIDHEFVTGLRGDQTRTAAVIYEVSDTRIEKVWFVD